MYNVYCKLYIYKNTTKRRKDNNYTGLGFLNTCLLKINKFVI